MNSLLILAADAEKYDRLVRAADLQQLQIRYATDPGSASALTADTNIILGEPLMINEVLASTGRLQWVQSSWAGVDGLCRPELRRDYVLTGLKSVFGPMITEYVMAYLFALERRVFEMQANQLKKRWQPLPYRPAGDIVLGIIGLGSIGQHLARTARHFGIHVIGLNRSGEVCAEVEKVFTFSTMAEFLAQPDYVVVTLPDTPQTRHMINASTLEMMKASTVLINVGRGGVVNEADLTEALQQGIIGGAVLDVFATEPLPTNNPLWHLPNVYITPHFAAESCPEAVVNVFVENYQRFLRRDSLLHRIDFERGY